MDHRHRQRQALTDAQRHIVGQGVDDFSQSEALHQFVHPGRNSGLGQGEQACMQDEVLAHGEFPVERKSLRHIANAAPRLNVARIDDLAEQPRGALAGRQ